MPAGRYGLPIPSTSPKVGFPLLASGVFYGCILKIESFTKSIMDIANGNFICEMKLAIVTLSPPPSQRMDLSLLFVSGLFFRHFPNAQRKNPRSIPMRVSLSTLVPSSRSGFCERIMKGNADPVYMRCTIVQVKKKPAGVLGAGRNPIL